MWFCHRLHLRWPCDEPESRSRLAALGDPVRPASARLVVPRTIWRRHTYEGRGSTRIRNAGPPPSAAYGLHGRTAAHVEPPPAAAVAAGRRLESSRDQAGPAAADAHQTGRGAAGGVGGVHRPRAAEGVRMWGRFGSLTASRRPSARPVSQRQPADYASPRAADDSGVLPCSGCSADRRAAVALTFLVSSVLATFGAPSRQTAGCSCSGRQPSISWSDRRRRAIVLAGPGRYGFDGGRGWARRPFIGSFLAGPRHRRRGGLVLPTQDQPFA